MSLNPDQFVRDLGRLYPRADFLIAYSGGLDSTVLIHLCSRGSDSESRKRFQAVHVDHGLQPQSGQWAAQCMAACAEFDLGCRVVALDRFELAGRSLEEAARTARYAALVRFMTENTVLMTAQHRDDQAETILLQLLRGSGLRGLSGMPEAAAFGPGVLLRPLLHYSRLSIRAYADHHALRWIDDPSNLDTVHDRNYLRQEVIPKIKKRWPAMDKTLARSGRHCATAQNSIDAWIEPRYRSIANRNRNTVLISKLIKFDESEQQLILRHWIRCAGFRSPSAVKLLQIIREVVRAASDRVPKVQWDRTEIRRYRDELYLFRSPQSFDRDQVIAWNLRDPLAVPGLDGQIECHWAEPADEKPAFPAKRVSVRFRKGGEICRLPGRQGTRSLKKVLQELTVPPWERNRIPLIYLEEELAAIADFALCEPFQKLGIEIRWNRRRPRIDHNYTGRCGPSTIVQEPN